MQLGACFLSCQTQAELQCVITWLLGSQVGKCCLCCFTRLPRVFALSDCHSHCLCLFYLSVYLLPCRTCRFDMKLGRNRDQSLLEINPIELFYFSLNPCGGGRRRRKLLKEFMLFHVNIDSWQSLLQAWRIKRVIEKSGEMPRRQNKGNLHHSVSMKIKMFLWFPYNTVSIQYWEATYLIRTGKDPFPSMKMQQCR